MTSSKTYVRGIIPDAENRELNDFYPTPPEGTEALLQVETFDGPIWEPACGNGAISEVLKTHGYEVISTDLVDRGYGETGIDFLMEYKPLAPNIITNPPYKLARPFIEKSLSLTTGKVAMLCRLAFLEGASRKEFFEQSPLARVWVFSKRLSIYRRGEEMKSGGMVAFAWYVWERHHEGPPVLGWI